MDSVTGTVDSDESRPAKRVRIEAPLHVAEEVQEEVVDDDDWDDIYATGLDGTVESKPVDEKDGGVPIPPSSTGQALPPGLGDGVTAPTSQSSIEYVPPAADGRQASAGDVQSAEIMEEIKEDGVPQEAMNDEDDFDAQELYGSTVDGRQMHVDDDTAKIESDPAHQIESSQNEEVGVNLETNTLDGDVGVAESGLEEGFGSLPVEALEGAADDIQTNGDISESKPKPAEDPEFLAAAAAQKDNQEAEWQFDSSDADSSSDSSSDTSSDEDSESGSEGGYEMLDPEAAAKILMSGDGDDGDGDNNKNKSGEDRQPRTANEVKEQIVPKPDVVITADMKVTYLGTVDRTLDNWVLIKGATPGEYQVLESGSVLCRDDREVIGAVAETLGRVQEPMYSVAFTNAKDIEDSGLEFGTKIYYVDSHSTFVFTQPLKNMKGTDASNIHDEEVGEDELEFSDDEAEAEYKRQKKLAKRGGRGGLSRSAFNEERAAGRTFGVPEYDNRPTFMNGSDAPQHQYIGGLSYDEGDEQDEFYSPLKRPDDLSQLMAGGGPPPRAPPGQFDRGRGRGRGDRGRGRGDRGRGRGGFDNRHQRGGRGGHAEDTRGRGGYQQQNGHRGNADSFPDRHNNGHKQPSLPPKPFAPQNSSPRQYYQYQPHQQQQPSGPQTYNFNGYTFQYGNPPPQPAPPPQQGYYNQTQQQTSSPTGSIPAGSYVNPAFFQAQQNQWMQPQQQQAAHGGGWPQQHVQNQYGSSAQQPQVQQQNNLAEILRQFGGQQQ